MILSPSPARMLVTSYDALTAGSNFREDARLLNGADPQRDGVSRWITTTINGSSPSWTTPDKPPTLELPLAADIKYVGELVHLLITHSVGRCLHSVREDKICRRRW
jgi:hypothetical protein